MCFDLLFFKQSRIFLEKHPPHLTADSTDIGSSELPTVYY